MEIACYCCAILIFLWIRFSNRKTMTLVLAALMLVSVMGGCGAGSVVSPVAVTKVCAETQGQCWQANATAAFNNLLIDVASSVTVHIQQQAADETQAEVTRAPKLFSGLPVLIDPNGHRIDLPAIADAARTQGLVPVAVVEADEDTAAAARGIGLGVLQRGALDAANGTSNRPRSEDRPAARIVDQPVRSGQQLYARGTDLIIRAAVSPGAEVLADGSIHVYGALRGRALAGCRGEESARIFCQSLEAELVAIAGNYLVAEDMASEHRKQPSMVRLSDEKLTIETL